MLYLINCKLNTVIAASMYVWRCVGRSSCCRLVQSFSSLRCYVTALLSPHLPTTPLRSPTRRVMTFTCFTCDRLRKQGDRIVSTLNSHHFKLRLFKFSDMRSTQGHTVRIAIHNLDYSQAVYVVSLLTTVSARSKVYIVIYKGCDSTKHLGKQLSLRGFRCLATTGRISHSVRPATC